MRTWTMWLLLQAAFWGIAAGATHLHMTASPERVAIVLDDSHPMARDWTQARACVRAVARGARYRQVAVLSPRRVAHRWQTDADPGNLRPYAPRDLGRVLDHPLLGEADAVVVVTNAAELDALPDTDTWSIVRPTPGCDAE